MHGARLRLATFVHALLSAFAGGALVVAAIRFDGHKHRIDVGKNIGSVHRLLVVLSSIVK
jgi:hypothetical protein